MFHWCKTPLSLQVFNCLTSLDKLYYLAQVLCIVIPLFLHTFEFCIGNIFFLHYMAFILRIHMPPSCVLLPSFCLCAKILLHASDETIKVYATVNMLVLMVLQNSVLRFRENPENMSMKLNEEMWAFILNMFLNGQVLARWQRGKWPGICLI